MSEAATATRGMTREERKVIVASSLGTVFEWYDFYLYGSLAAIIGAKFFSMYDESTRNIFALLAFAAGFLVRPFGALVFGKLGDMAGRKKTFLLTIVLMGGATFLVGILPTSETIGFAAPVLLIALRMLQGLALGGEYGGAATYVAEHAPQDRRGYYTSFIQITATAGLLLSLVVIMGVRGLLGEAAFQDWGWRIPFWASLILLFISVWIRLQLAESPAWQRMKDDGKLAKRAPWKEAFLTWRNGRYALFALLGLTMGQAVVWYTGQFYALFFLNNVLKVDAFTSNAMIAWALLIACPFFVVFGRLSDRVGRKPIILGGCLLASLTYFWVFYAMAWQTNPALHAAQETVRVEVIADPATCSVQFNPTGTRAFTQPCDVAKAALSRASVSYTNVPAPAGAATEVVVGGNRVAVEGAGFAGRLTAALAAAGYPAAQNPTVVRMDHLFDIAEPRTFRVLCLLVWLVLLVTMVYGPIAAALVELFPTNIRYTAMSLPYHIGNGWFGGLLPAVVFALNAEAGNVYSGLWYPVIVALATVVIGLLFVPETRGRDIYAEERKEA